MTENKEYTPTFEEELSLLIKDKFKSEIRKIEFTRLDYNSRKVIPDEFINKLWMQIDWDEVIQQVKPEMEKRICNSIIGAMETEIKTDVKKVMCIDGVRQKLRVEIYPRLMKILDEV